MRRYKQLIRVYKNTREITAARRMNHTDYSDITGVDTGGTLEPDDETIEVTPPGKLTLRRGIVAMDTGVDVQPGYLLEIKKTKVLGRAVSAVSATVSSNPAADDTELAVDNIINFQAGDHCILTDSSGSWTFRLKNVDTDDSELDLHEAVPRAFTSATVRVAEYWLVTGIKDRTGQSEFQYLKVVETTLEAP